MAHLDAGDIWLAVRQLRRERHFRPNLAEILVACKIRRVEMAEQARHQQLHTGNGRGVPMPPETRQALEILQETLRPGVTREQRVQARQMIERLADDLAERHPVRDPEEEFTSA